MTHVLVRINNGEFRFGKVGLEAALMDAFPLLEAKQGKRVYQKAMEHGGNDPYAIVRWFGEFAEVCS
jgi:hypothetical protein